MKAPRKHVSGFAELTPRLFTSLRAGYSRRAFTNDLFAGVTVGVVALPLAMAFAIASGVSPDKGLVTAIVAGFLISALGGSRVQIGGPTGAFVVVIYGILESHGYAGLAAATLMAGVLLMIMGFAGLGALIKYIPYPVITGFTTGIALIIFSGQVKEFFGFDVTRLPADFIGQWTVYFERFDTIQFETLGVGMLSLVTFAAIRRWAPQLPGAIIAVLAGCCMVYLAGFTVDTIGSRFGEIPRNFPPPALPAFDFAQARALFPAAFTVAFLAAIESLLSAVIADGMTSDRHNSNGELVAQGVANIASVCFGGIPATGAIARTATNIRSGAQTPIAGIIHAVTLLLLMLVFAPWVSYIPLASLAAILFVVAWNMSELHQFMYFLRAPRADVIVLLSTFLLTVLVDLTAAIEVGVVLSALSFMQRMSEATETKRVGAVFQDDPGTADAPDALWKKTIPPEVEVFQIQGPVFFGIAEKFKDLSYIGGKPPRYLIIRMRKVPVIDASGLHALREIWLRSRKQGTLLLLSGVQPRVERSLKKIGLWKEIGAENICADIDSALGRVGALQDGSESL